MKHIGNLTVSGSIYLSGSMLAHNQVLEATSSYATSASYAETTPMPQYIIVGKSADQPGTGTGVDVTFDTTVVSNGLTLSGNTIQLTGGKTYDIEARLWIYGSGTQLEASIHDSANNPINVANHIRVFSGDRSATQSNNPALRTIYSPSVDTSIKLRTFFTANNPTVALTGAALIVKEIK